MAGQRFHNFYDRVVQMHQRGLELGQPFQPQRQQQQSNQQPPQRQQQPSNQPPQQQPSQQQQQQYGTQQNAQVGQQPIATDPRINQDVPMGDPIQSIAQMLSLDLSAAASPEQQGQAVVSAVEALVLKLHELTGEPLPDQINDEQQDEFGSNGEDQEYNEQDGDEIDDVENGDDQGNDDQGGDEPPDNQDDEPSPPPQKKRQGFAASFDTPSPRVMTMLRQGRTREIQQLALEGYLSPHGAKLFTERYCSTQSLALSLSHDDEQQDDFDARVEEIRANGKVVLLGERSGNQSGLSKLGSDGSVIGYDEQRNSSDNPMVRIAEQRAEAVKQKTAQQKRYQ